MRPWAYMHPTKSDCQPPQKCYGGLYIDLYMQVCHCMLVLIPCLSCVHVRSWHLFFKIDADFICIGLRASARAPQSQLRPRSVNPYTKEVVGVATHSPIYTIAKSTVEARKSAQSTVKASKISAVNGQAAQKSGPSFDPRSQLWLRSLLAWPALEVGRVVWDDSACTVPGNNHHYIIALHHSVHCHCCHHSHYCHHCHILLSPLSHTTVTTVTSYCHCSHHSAGLQLGLSLLANVKMGTYQEWPPFWCLRKAIILGIHKGQFKVAIRTLLALPFATGLARILQ